VQGKKKKTSKKGKKSKGKGKSQLKKLMIPNKILENDEKKFKGKLKEYTKCKIKKDVLNMLIKNGKEKKYLNKIQLKPVYIILSKSSLNIQNGQDTSTLFIAIPLKKILRISQQEKIKQFFCLDFHYMTNKKKNNIVTLCPKNEKEKNNWLSTLQEFKECSVKIKKVNLNDKLVYDFSKVNSLLKNTQKKESNTQKAKEKVKIQKKFIETSQKDKKLFYDTTNPVKKTSRAEKANKKKVTNIVKSMMDTFKNNKIREQQVKRKMKNKLKEAKIMKKKMSKKQKKLANVIQSSIRKQKMKKLKLISLKSKSQTVKLLSAVKSKVKEMQNDGIKKIKNGYKDKIKSKTKTAEKKAKKMMKMIQESKKLKNFDKCINPKIYKFRDPGYIISTCKSMFGLYAYKKCATKKTFCSMCCSNHIGVSHVKKMFSCKKKCIQFRDGIKKPKDYAKEKKKK